ncbi:MAG: hypothetical protein Q7J32_01420 [Sphingomonadaceae bacterium]|nr:hypothetical protein [Sphingomonadaceae bacterium]
MGTVSMMAATAVAILAFNTLSLHVSAERSKVDRLQASIARDLRDIRALEAELRTRARLPVLQKWNDNVLAMSAPTAKQFASSPVQLAAFAPDAAAVAGRAANMQLARATPGTLVVPQPGMVKAAYEVPAPAAMPREVVISYGAATVSRPVPAKAAAPQKPDARTAPKPDKPTELADAKPKPKPPAKGPAKSPDLDALIGAIDEAAANGGGFQKVSMQ